MTCHSPTHHALISMGANTYCGECFFAGFNRGQGTPKLEFNDPVLKELLRIAQEAKETDNSHYQKSQEENL